MKPSWDDAPEWAQLLAMDEDGGWWWFQCPPVQGECMWIASDGGFRRARVSHSDWKDSLEQRPKEEPE